LSSGNKNSKNKIQSSDGPAAILLILNLNPGTTAVIATCTGRNRAIYRRTDCSRRKTDGGAVMIYCVIKEMGPGLMPHTQCAERLSADDSSSLERIILYMWPMSSSKAYIMQYAHNDVYYNITAVAKVSVGSGKKWFRTDNVCSRKTNSQVDRNNIIIKKKKGWLRLLAGRKFPPFGLIQITPGRKLVVARIHYYFYYY